MSKETIKCTNVNNKKEGLETRWHENGQKKTETNWKNGERHGLMTEWYDDGRKLAESNWKNGKKHGLLTIWFDTTDTVRMETNYKDDKKHGSETFFKKDGSINEFNYEDDILI
jgi:antitoxin component YwqK of YwqJK toxin-antitoxin module